jgi:tripartite-type tricarboxylate transporter receptor subunit TctC
VLAEPDVRERLQKIGNEPMGTSPAEFADDIAREVPQWGKVIEAAGLTGTQ